MAAIDANGITIEYDVRGEGEPLLLVMGLSGQLIDWPDEFVDLLVASGFQVIRFDNRDAGLSTEFHWTPPSRARSAAALLARRRPKAGYLIADMAADGAGLLRALDIGPAHVVGASMGGMIAQTMAIEHPDSVKSLTSIMSNTGNNRHGLPRRKVLIKLSRFGHTDHRERRGIVAQRLPPGRRTGGRCRAVPPAGAGEPRAQLPSVGRAAPNRGDRRQSRSHRRAPAAPRPVARDSRPCRSAREALRRHRDGAGDTWLATLDVPGDGSRHAPVAVAGDGVGDQAERVTRRSV